MSKCISLLLRRKPVQQNYQLLFQRFQTEVCALKVKKSFGDNLTFHSNLSLNKSCIRHFPCFYENIFLNWKQYLSTDPETLSGILSQNSLLNKHIVIDNSIVNFTKLSQKIPNL